MSANLYTLFQDRFPDDLSQPFLSLQNGHVFTYGDVESTAVRFANLVTALGVKPGDRVAVQVEKSAAALLFYLGCLRAGAVYLPLNTAYTGEELDYFLGDAAPVLMVCDPSAHQDMNARAKKFGVSHVLTLDSDGQGSLTQGAGSRNAAAPSAPGSAPRSQDDLAAILYSSGTTGRPKGAMLSHGALAANALALHKVWQFGPGDVLLHALPIFHTHGLFVATNTVLMNGTSMIFHNRFDAAAVISDLSRATVFMGVPTYYTRLLSHDGLNKEACQSIRLFVSGSAPLLDETFETFKTRTGHTIVERYGMTEAGIITSAQIDKPRRAGAVGWPLDGVGLRVVDETNAPVPDGATGDVQIKGSSLFTGYWNKPGKTAEEFNTDSFFSTGDIGQVDPDGQLALVGRAKDMFISGGFNVFPKEIEHAIDTMAGVEESAVVGLPHPDFGEAGLAIVVVEESSMDLDSIRTELKGVLANYKVPKLVVRADTLPRNAMGKVQKNVLREQYRSVWKESLDQ